MDLTSCHRDHVADEVNEMESSWENAYVDRISIFKRQKSDSTKSPDDVFAEAASQSPTITFDGYSSDFSSTNSSKDEWVDDCGDEFHPRQMEKPRRPLANAHMLPPHDSGDDEDDEDDVESVSENEDEVFIADYSGDVFEADTELSGRSVSDEVGPNASATGQPSSFFHLAHDGQSGQQDVAFSAYFQILDARVQSGKRGKSCCHKQAQPALRDEHIKSSAGKRGPRDDNHGGETGDFVMVDAEAEEEEMTDSCLNLISHLDYVMFPSAEVLEFVRGGEMEVLEDVDNEEASCRRFLGEEYYDGDNRELGMGELGNRARRWFRCGVFSRT